MLYFVSLAIAILGVPLAILIRRGELVFLVLGLFFLGEGIYYVYLASPWGPGSSSTLFDFLLGFSVLGFPLAILSLSIFVLWWTGKSAFKTFEVIQFSTCVFFNVVNFGVSMLSPWSEITRFGGAALAIGFGILNFIRVLIR